MGRYILSMFKERHTETTRSRETQDKDNICTTRVKGTVLAKTISKVDDKDIIRKASHQDKEAVLSINDNIYDGQDYLPAHYDHFIRDPDITSYVLKRNGEIASFIAAHLVDDGHTVCIRAGRTKPKHSGQRLYSRLLEHVINSTRALVLVFHTTTYMCMRNYTQVETQVYYEFTLLPTQLNIDWDKRNDNESVKEQSEEQLKVLLSSEMYNNYLFPCRRLLINWVPIQPTISNMSKWMTHAEGKTSVFSDVSYKGDKPVGLLSFSTIYPCKTPGNVIAIFVYGSEFESLKSHVLLHMKVLCDTVTTETLVNINFETDIDRDHLQISLTNLNMSAREVSELIPIKCVVNKRNL